MFRIIITDNLDHQKMKIQTGSRSFKSLLWAIALATLASSCVPFGPFAAPLDNAAPPVDKLALPKKTDRKKLAEGRQLYATSCSHCHGAPRVDRHGSDEKWTQRILPGMCKKSKLNAEQTAAVEAYVLAARKSLAQKQVN
jgi:mono/diheme cytochrome c family protein